VYDEAMGALDDGSPQLDLEHIGQILEQDPDHRPTNELRGRALHALTAKVLSDCAVDNLRRGNAAACPGALNELDQHGRPGG
jgi:hypothetical protein